MADKETPKVVEDPVDPPMGDEQTDLLDDIGEPEPKAAEKPAEPDLSAYQRAREATIEKASKPPEPPKELDVRDWQTRMVQDERFAGVADPNTDLHRVQQEHLANLKRTGYGDPDIDYQAALLAYNDPRISKSRNTERVREAASTDAGRFERPTRRTGEEKREPVLRGRAAEIADYAKIVNPEIRKFLAGELAKIQKMGER